MTVGELMSELGKHDPNLIVNLMYTTEWTSESGTGWSDDHFVGIVSVAYRTTDCERGKAVKAVVLSKDEYFPPC